MTIALDNIIAEMKMYSPEGVSLPRNPADNEVAEETIERWAEDAAQAINERRGITTLKEMVITTQAGVQEYSVADNTREVVKIERQHARRPSAGLCDSTPFSALPTGQLISFHPSLDVIARQNAARTVREDDWEMFEGRIRFLFPTADGEKIRVTYRTIDRSLENVPEDRFSLVLTYCLWQNINWYVGKYGASIVQDGDRMGMEPLTALQRLARQLEHQWNNGLGGITSEAA